MNESNRIAADIDPTLPTMPLARRLLCSLSGLEPEVAKKSWASDLNRAAWLVGGMGFIFCFQWLIWSLVVHQVVVWYAALLLGLVPPVGLMLFDRLAILPSLWEPGPDARLALALPPSDIRRQALALIMRLLVSLAFAWVAAQYLTLAVESDSLRTVLDADRRATNDPLGNADLFPPAPTLNMTML